MSNSVLKNTLNNLLYKKIYKTRYAHYPLDIFVYNEKILRENIPKPFPAANQEWINSIYTYYKNNIKLLPITDKIVNKLIKAYFNFSPYKDKKKSIRKFIKSKRFSSNRIFVSKAFLKHTNNNVTIMLFTYNRQINNIKSINQKSRLKNILKVISLEKRKNKIRTKRFVLKNNFLKKVKSIAIKLKKNKNKYNVNKIKKRCNYFFKFLKAEKKRNNFLIYKVRELVYLYKFKRDMLELNEKKFYLEHLYNLRNIFKNLYNKKVEFLIINLKKLHLNSDIFSQAIAIKLRNRKNKLLKVLSKALYRMKIPSFNKRFLFNYKLFGIFHTEKNFLTKEIFDNSSLNKDILHEFFYEVFSKKNKSYSSLISIKNIVRNAFSSLNHKKINGIKLEASGRLTRRLTASRSVFKTRSRGTLKNMSSSYKGFSRVILKGYLKSNIQYTIINSKTRNGSFGLKGWISSY